MSDQHEDTQTELLRLYRDNFELRQDRQLAACKEQERLREAFDALRNEKLVLEGQLEEANAQNETLKTVVLDLENTAQEHAGNFSEIKNALEVIKTENENHISKNTELERSLHELQAKIAELEKHVPEDPQRSQHARPIPLAREEQRASQLPPEGGPSAGGPGAASGRRIARRQGKDDTTTAGAQLPRTPETDGDPEPRRTPRAVKRRRVDSDQGAEDGSGQVTKAALEAAFPAQFAALARAEKLNKGLWRGYCVYEVACELLELLELDGTPGHAVAARVERRLPGAARRVRLSAWDVLAASGCYASAGTYRNQHSRFTRMAHWHARFFVHARGAKRLRRVRDAQARDILRAVEDFFAGRATGGTTEDWEQRLRELNRLLPEHST